MGCCEESGLQNFIPARPGAGRKKTVKVNDFQQNQRESQRRVHSSWGRISSSCKEEGTGRIRKGQIMGTRWGSRLLQWVCRDLTRKLYGSRFS